MQGTAATDSQLLDCFVKGGDSAAFRSLVLRHGPAVLQVCRGVLHDPHEAEDAFQATFLVLVGRRRRFGIPSHWVDGSVEWPTARRCGRVAMPRGVG